VKNRGFQLTTDLACGSDAARMADDRARLNRAAIAMKHGPVMTALALTVTFSPIQMGGFSVEHRARFDLRAFADMDGLIMNQVRTRIDLADDLELATSRLAHDLRCIFVNELPGKVDEYARGSGITAPDAPRGRFVLRGIGNRLNRQLRVLRLSVPSCAASRTFAAPSSRLTANRAHSQQQPAIDPKLVIAQAG